MLSTRGSQSLLKYFNFNTTRRHFRIIGSTYSSIRLPVYNIALMNKTLSNTQTQHKILTTNTMEKNSLYSLFFIQNRQFSSTRDQKLPIIYLFTKEQCSLCDEAKQILLPYKHRFTLEEVDITLPENADWYELYKYDIPVFHIYEDFLFKHRVDLPTLEAALLKYESRTVS